MGKKRGDSLAFAEGSILVAGVGPDPEFPSYKFQNSFHLCTDARIRMTVTCLM